MKKIIIILCCILLLGVTGCTKEENEEPKETRDQMIERVLQEGNYVIVDVRTKEEYETAHIKGAINIPYDEIDENTDLPKEKTIFVYCKSGTRSGYAYDNLTKLGYEVIILGAFDAIDMEKE